jgi:CRP-like cAMP-binding protein
MITAVSSYALAAPGTNRLFSSLLETDRTAIMRQLHRIRMPVRMDIYEQDGPVEYAYFPLSGIVSTTALMNGGTMVEVGVTGAEGFLGTSLLLGSRRSPHRTFVQVTGEALRIGADDLLLLCEKNALLQKLLLQFTQAMFSQGCQTAACNRLHDAEERLSRWLLMVQDRMASDELPITHEFLGMMLGTRRSTVTIAAGILQRMGAIEYRRGHIQILNRPQLEDAACECYERSRMFVEQVFDHH